MVLEILAMQQPIRRGLSQNGVPDSLNESQCNSIVIVLLRSASVIGPEIVISELFQFNSWVIFREKISLFGQKFRWKICILKYPHFHNLWAIRNSYVGFYGAFENFLSKIHIFWYIEIFDQIIFKVAILLVADGYICPT